jgi:hypothetical protein
MREGSGIGRAGILNPIFGVVSGLAKATILKGDKEQIMAFTKEELAQYRKIVNTYVEKRRPPEHLRKQVGYFCISPKMVY